MYMQIEYHPESRHRKIKLFHIYYRKIIYENILSF